MFVLLEIEPVFRWAYFLYEIAAIYFLDHLEIHEILELREDPLYPILF